MSKRLVSLLLIVCMIFGMIPVFASAAEPAVVSEDEDAIHIDFKDTVRQMSEQDWYDDLTTVQTADGYDAKRIGSKINTPGMSETELNAYAAMRQWLGETQIWNINEQRGGFINPSGNRLYFCYDENVAWGLSLNNYYRGTDPENSLSLTVNVEKAGRYDLSMVVSHVTMSSQDFVNDAYTETNFGYVDIYVNGKLLYEDYCFRGEGLAETALGAVMLSQGSNEITFCCTKNYVGNANPTPCYHFNLRSLTFVRQEVETTHIDFKETVKQMQQQSWYDDLPQVKTGNGYDAARVGSKINTPGMSESEKAAYAELRAWLEETQIWSINEERGNFINPSGNRLYFCGDDREPWGLSLNNYYRGTDPENSLSLVVDVAAAGHYNLSMQVSKVTISSKDFPCDVDVNETNFGYVDVYLNGQLLKEDYCFRGEGLETVELGVAQLQAGENEITFCATKNYVGNANPTPAYHFNLRSLTIMGMSKAKVTEEAKNQIRLQGGYLALDAVVSAETHSVRVKDESILTAFINENGLLEVLGLMPGETEVEVFENGEAVCSVPITVTQADYSDLAPIVMDFKDFAKQAQQQSFWKDFRNAVDENTKYIGTLNYYDTLSSSEKAAYDALMAWSKENFDWHIDEGLSLYSVTGAFKRFYLNGQDGVPWGFTGYTYYHGKGTPAEAANSKFAFVVEAPADGWYQLDMTTFKEDESWAGIYGTIGDNSGGDLIAVYVNGEEAIYDYTLIAPNQVAKDTLGAVYLTAGENSVVVDSLLSFNNLPVAGRSNVPLIKMEFTPLTGVSVQAYLSRTLDLRQSYLCFNDDVSGLTVESTDEQIVMAEINAGGVVTMTGRKAGNAKVFVRRGDEILCIIPVEVTPFEGTLDELDGSPVHVDCGITVDTQAEIPVEIPAEGTYNLTLRYRGSSGAVSLNGEKLHTLPAAEDMVSLSLGAVEFNRGENILKLEADAMELSSVICTPLGTCRTEVGREQYLELTKTYLAYDEQASSYTVSVSGSAAANMENGTAVITGTAPGRAVLTLSGEKTFTIPVQVEAYTELQSVTYTADGFKAETLQVGSTAVGDLRGETESGMSLSEQYLQKAGNVFYTTSDSKIVSVDQKTGDLTAVAEGSAVVTVYAMLDGVTKKDSVTISVSDDTDLEEIRISNPVDYVTTGNTLQLYAYGTKASGAAANMANFPVSWSVDEAAIASVSAEGVLTGLSEGTVTVTATAVVDGMPISHTVQIEVVDNALLPTTDIILQFDEGRSLDIFDLELVRDGVELDLENTNRAGERLSHDGQGIHHDGAVGKGLAFYFTAKQSGYYLLYIQGKQLASVGGMNHVYVDGQFMGYMDNGSNNGNFGAGGRMDTIWLEAGTHHLNIVSQGEHRIMLGRVIFYPTKDPGTVDITVNAKNDLVVGEQTELTLSMRDANYEKWHLLLQEAPPEHTNYYMIKTSDASVVEVSGATLIAKNPGTATITVTGEAAGQEFVKTVTVTVTDGTVASAELSAERTTVKPDQEPFVLTLTAFDAEGNAGGLPAEATVTYESSNESILTVAADGTVTLTGSLGSALVTAAITENGHTVTAELWLSVNAAKTEPTVFTYEERANAQENVRKYDWAWSMKEQAVKKADFYVEHLDEIYDMWIPGYFPRSSRVGFRSDPNYGNCRYCGEYLLDRFGVYPWIVDALNNPWKVTCPICRRDFPSNDFGSYYESGLDENGVFRKELADPQYLKNELYPEMGEGWGVDDGWGFITTNAAGNSECHTYIAYYLGVWMSGFAGNAESADTMWTILPTLADAYLYTGDEKYGSAGAILIDRLADIYPTYDFYDMDWVNYNFVCALSGHGRLIGITWDAVLGIEFAKCVDVFWPAAENADVIEYLKAKAPSQGKDPEDITPEYLRTKAEDDILMDLYEMSRSQWIDGNFGMSEAAVAYSARCLNRLPISQEMVDWIYHTEALTGSGRDTQNAGGDVARTLVEWTSRDGLAYEGSYAYNSIMEGYLLDVADALDGFDLVEGADLWENQKFVNLYAGHMRMTVCGRLTPQIHEGGGPQSTNFIPNIGYMTTAFSKSGDPQIARALYAANMNSTDGLHADIFTKNPEAGLRSAIQTAVDTYGTWDMSDSDLLPGYGIAILREGPHDYLGAGVNAHEFSDYWIGFGYSDTDHAQIESLNLDLEFHGLNLSSSMGYPTVVQASSHERQQWVRNTISHNTVVVNDKGQTPTDEAGFPLHFADDGYAKVMDIEDSKAYQEAQIYRRTLVAVDNGEGDHYGVDFFRVLGGSEHVYSFHGMTDVDPETTGLDLTYQGMGTYAGPDIPYGDWQISGSTDAILNTGSGYSWMDDVYRDAAPETTFTVDWAIKDFRHRLPTTDGIHLKLHMMSEDPMTEVALANGYPPDKSTNAMVPHMEYMLVRRSGNDDLDSLFTTVIEPYQHKNYVAASELVDVVLVEGTETINDKAAAIKVTLKSGRVDYVVYATNPNCLYRVADKFDFMGFAGVVSYTDGKITYAWGNEATVVADVVEDARPSITGTVTDFTKDITRDGYYMTIQMDEPATAKELTDRWIYVQTDGIENGVYRIYDAEVKGNTAVLDLRHQTLVRDYMDKMDFSKGYKYNISEGAGFTIPLSAAFDVGDVLNYTNDTIVRAGAKLNLAVGTGNAAYEAEGLPSGMKLDAKTGALTWTTSKTQAGRYPITVKALRDGEIMGTMSFTIYVVSYSGSSYAQDVCAHSKTVTYTVDDVIETVCPACGLVTKEAVEADEKFDIAGSNMTLGNELKLNVLVNSADLGNGIYTAKITHGENVTEEELVKYNSNYHYVTYAVSAKEMADTITVEIYDENGEAVSNVYETSVRTYAMRLLGMNQTDEVKTLLVDMLNYGAEAQTYFKYNEVDLANSKLTDAQKALATGEVSCTNKQVKGQNFYGANLSLEDRIVLNLFFKNCKEEMYAKVIYTDYTGKTITVQKSLEPYSGSIYKIVIDDIVLADAFSAVNVTVYNADGMIHGTAADSVESYVARTGSSALNEAIMKFAYAAKQYLS